MTGFLKGLLTGLLAAAVAFLAFAFLVPLEPEPPAAPEIETPVDDAAPPEAPEPIAPEDAAEEDAGAGSEAVEAPPPPAAEAGGDVIDPEDRPAEPPAGITAPDAPIAEIPDEPADSPATAEDAGQPEPDAAPDDVTPEAPEMRPATEPGEIEQESGQAPSEPGAEALPEARALAAERGETGADALTEPADEAPSDDAALPDALPDEEPAVAPAWQRHAAAFEAPEGLALYAVVLIDAPADPRAEAKLLALSAPVTVALDPADPDAPRRAEAYRSAGHEVAILASGALPAEAAAALPEAVAWLAPEADDWPADDAGAERLAAMLEAEGLAVILRGDAPGVAPMDRLAVAPVVVAVDPALESRAEVLALFDRAAEAVTGEAVTVLLGHVAHPPVLEALMQRAGRERAAPAAPAPLSAVLAGAR